MMIEGAMGVGQGDQGLMEFAAWYLVKKCFSLGFTQVKWNFTTVAPWKKNEKNASMLAIPELLIRWSSFY